MGLTLRAATVVDGTGAPGRRTDVRVVGDRIVAVGEGIADAGDEIVDLSGLVLAPGFIDIHTHYDAQVLWDPDLTPSSWHGVTTVVMGNCGFGIAPTRSQDRRAMVRTLENVEGMSADALDAGIDWSFETFPEYLDALDRRRTRINVATYVGHTPVRRYVLGSEASERTATDAEIETMREIVAEAVDAGAIGFSTSKLPTHVGEAGKPVPSRLASTDEIFRVASAVGDAGRGVLAVTPGEGLAFDEFAELSLSTGRPVTWTALLTKKGHRGMATGLVDETTARGEIWPQVSCRPLVSQFTLAEPFPLEILPVIAELLERSVAERAAAYADPAWREQARPQLEMQWGGRWDHLTVAESNSHPELVGTTIAELAAERGSEPADTLLDVGLEDDLGTRLTAVLSNDDETEIAELLNDRRTILGLSDAGAHASQLCDACFATDLLGRWVRDKQALNLEDAVWRLAGQPASVMGFDDRGVIAPGKIADLVAFDAGTVAPTDLERVWDLPAGADRLIAESIGVEHVWVAGEPIRRGAEALPDAYPGRLIRGG